MGNGLRQSESGFARSDGLGVFFRFAETCVAGFQAALQPLGATCRIRVSDLRVSGGFFTFQAAFVFLLGLDPTYACLTTVSGSLHSVTATIVLNKQATRGWNCLFCTVRFP